MAITLIPVACFAVGCFTGAWLFYRGRSGTGPLPTIFHAKSKEEKPKEGIKLPKVKP